MEIMQMLILHKNITLAFIRTGVDEESARGLASVALDCMMHSDLACNEVRAVYRDMAGKSEQETRDTIRAITEILPGGVRILPCDDAAAKGEATPKPMYPCEMCGTDTGDAKNIHRALAQDGNTYQVCNHCASQTHRWQEVNA